MRILHIAEASYAGVGRHVLDLARHQLGQGHEVTVLYGARRESDGFRRERLQLPEITWRAIPAQRRPGRADLAALRATRTAIRRQRPHVVHGHSTKGGLLARLARSGRRRHRVVYTPHAVYSLNPDLDPLRRRAVGQVERALSRRTDAIIAVSPEEAAHLRQLGIDPARLWMIPNGLPPIERADRHRVRTELGIDRDRPVIGFVGRLAPQKAPDQLLDVIRLVARTRSDVDLLVVGDGPLRPELAATVAGDPDLAGRVHLVGERPGPWAMAAMDVFALPSRYEGLPYVLLEASQLGLPMVVTTAATSSLLGQRGATIVEVEPGDRPAMAEACLNLLDGAGNRRSLPTDARFTVEAMGRHTEAAYLGRRPDRAEPGAPSTIDLDAVAEGTRDLDLDRHRSGGATVIDLDRRRPGARR